MPTNYYLTAYDHAGSEIAEIDARVQRLTRRKELLEQLLEPLSLLVSDPGSGAIPAYTIAYEQAVNELAEINTLIEALLRRKEILQRILEPLKFLVSESDSVQIASAASNGSYGEFHEAAAEASPVFLEEADLFEEPASVVLLEVEETDDQTGRSDPSISDQNQSFSDDRECISDGDVAELAYRFWDERGRLHGYHEVDWLRAMQELQHSAY